MKKIEKWLSYHIFCHNLIQHDRIICILNKWAIQEEISCFFFIRYWEGGPHIRFRIKTLESLNKNYHKILSELLESELSNDDIKLTKDQYYKGHKLDGEKIPLEKLPWYENNSIVSIPYVRENERYGGCELIEKAESVFYHSSQFAAAMLEEFLNCHMIIRLFFYIYTYEQIKIEIIKKKINFDFDRFYANCYSYWSELYGINEETYIVSVIDTIKHSFEEKEEKINRSFSFIKPIIKYSFIKNLIEYLEAVYQLRGKKMMRSVLFSQMHMFANRLGIPIEYECAIYRYYQLKTIMVTSRKNYK